MPNADTPYDPGFSCWFVQNMFQHHSVLAPAGCGDHQPLLRLAQGEGRVGVLSGKIRCHNPIEVIAHRPRFGVHRVPGGFTIVRAASPQWSDVFVRQVHVIANIHGPKNVCPDLQVTVPTIGPLGRVRSYPCRENRKRGLSISVAELNAGNQSSLVMLPGINTSLERLASQKRDCAIQQRWPQMI